MLEIQGGLRAKFSAIKDDIGEKLNQIYMTVTGFINRMKESFANMKIHIPLPHFSVSNWLNLPGGVSIPAGIDVDWYGKGLDAIFNKPTIIGVGSPGRSVSLLNRSASSACRHRP